MKYRDRKGNEFTVDTTQDKFLRNLYTSRVGNIFLEFMISPFVTNVIGKFMNSRLSTLKIDGFVHKNKIKMSDYERKHYSSYNDFFTRKIKKSKRPIDMNENTFVSPSDGKVSVYPITKNLVVNIKNCDYSVKSLIRSTELSEFYRNGWLYIIRLTVDNYHRYCYPDSGYQYENIPLPGIYHTVNPVAVAHASVYVENNREYTVIDSDHFGRILQMEVGAMGVGRITNERENCFVKKGQEKGYFEFGGSTICLFVPHNCVSPCEDLVLNTMEDCETIVKMGEVIGYAKN